MGLCRGGSRRFALSVSLLWYLLSPSGCPLVNVWGTLGQGEGPLAAVGSHLLGAETGELVLDEG